MKRNTKYEIRNTKQIKNLKFKIINGFTLIELLVVMAIIMLLMAVGLASYQNAQKSGRDGKRKTDLRQVQSALEMYRADNDKYPTGVNGDINGNLSTVISTGAPQVYLSTIPSDPTSSLYYYYDDFSASQTKYKLCAYLEGVTDHNNICSGISCGTINGGAVDCNYGILNP